MKRPSNRRLPQCLVNLYKLATKWERDALEDSRDRYPYIILLDNLAFHANLRFYHYTASSADGPFLHRLEKWISNLNKESQQQALFRLLHYFTFIDNYQMTSLYKDAFRRIVRPWLLKDQLSIDDHFSLDFDEQIITLLKECDLFCLTESFRFPEFLKVNWLQDLPKPSTLGETRAVVKSIIESSRHNRFIIFEDFVGKGGQASRILTAVKSAAPESQILFVPLIILETGLLKLQALVSPTFEILPVSVISAEACITSLQQQTEPSEYSLIRALVQETKERVCKNTGSHDDVPTNPFGHEDSGALIVTSHNAPNNTLPLIHHKTTSWEPLFRRLHHSYPKLPGKDHATQKTRRAKRANK